MMVDFPISQAGFSLGDVNYNAEENKIPSRTSLTKLPKCKLVIMNIDSQLVKECGSNVE